jgi:hypothetical protein
MIKDCTIELASRVRKFCEARWDSSIPKDLAIGVITERRNAAFSLSRAGAGICRKCQKEDIEDGFDVMALSQRFDIDLAQR